MWQLTDQSMKIKRLENEAVQNELTRILLRYHRVRDLCIYNVNKRVLGIIEKALREDVIIDELQITSPKIDWTIR